jgi:methanogenic corrinoid protein MtbC1
MSSLNDFAAEILETSAAGYAAAALAVFQPIDGAAWKTHLTQRVLELAAAVRVSQPSLFAQRMHWLRRAALARGGGEQELKRALLSLRTALEREIPDHLHAAIAPALNLAVGAFDDALGPEPVLLDAAKPVDRLTLRYLGLCLEGKPDEAIERVLRELDGGLAPVAIYTQVLLPAAKEIGQLWHVGDVSIAEEHLVSETTRELMALIVAKHAPPHPDGFSLIAASVAGNAHDLGLRAVADLFRLAGWRCLYLGANVPAAEIGRAAETFDVDLVVLNATLSTQIKPVGEAIETIRRLAPRRKILVGGLAFDGLSELPLQLGADAYSPTVDAAVSLGTALLDRER